MQEPLDLQASRDRETQNGADVGIGFSGRETSIEIRVHQFQVSCFKLRLQAIKGIISLPFLFIIAAYKFAGNLQLFSTNGMQEVLQQQEIDVGALRRLARSGIPDKYSIRAVAWKAGPLSSPTSCRAGACRPKSNIPPLLWRHGLCIG